MKIKLLKRMVSFVTALTLLLAFSITAFAAEPTQSVDLIPLQSQNIAPELVECGPPAKGTCVRGEFAALLIPYLNTTGFQRILVIQTECTSNTGFLEITLIDPNGNTLSGAMWVSGVNERTDWYFMIPTEGDYSLQLTPIGCVAPVYCTAQWFRQP